MTAPHRSNVTRRIAALNDRCRTPLDVGSRLVQTPGIAALSSADQSAIRERVEPLRRLHAGQRPLSGAGLRRFRYGDTRIFWKIDHYDRTCSAGSEDPSDPTQPIRVLTIMLASEY